METNHKQVFGPVISRLSDLMIHTNLYSSKGNKRLADAIGSNPTTISRLVGGSLTHPSFALVARITEAIEKDLGRRIDPRDIFAEFGAYLTRHVCGIVGCSGCTPARACDSRGNLLQAFIGVKPGEWVSSRYPNGYQSVTHPYDHR